MKHILATLGIATVLTVSGCTSGSTPPAATESPSGAVAAALPPEQPGPGEHRLALMHDGHRRDYELHAPPGYQPGKPIPLVLVFHGNPGTSADAARFSEFNPVADSKGFLVAYPQGNAAQWNATASGGGLDDVGFVGALIDNMIARWGADPKRVYAAGFSNGADFTYRVARELPGRFGAVAPISGVFKPMPGWSATIGAENPVSLLSVQGSLDAQAGAFSTVNNEWRRTAGCGEPVVKTTATNHGKAHRYTSTCANGSEHVVYSVIEMGHLWPVGTTYAINATPLIWEFFAAHPLR